MGILNSSNIPDELEGNTALIDFTVKWLFTFVKAKAMIERDGPRRKLERDI